MIIADVDHFQQKVVAIRPGRRGEFELPRAPDFALDGWFSFVVGAVGGAMSG
jgi:hypothetical protein